MDNGATFNSPMGGRSPYPGEREPDERVTVLACRRQAQSALLVDFRSRVASGEIVLEGLQIAPAPPANERSRIPALWAPFLKFEFSKNRVIAHGAEFANVKASRAAAAAVPVVSPPVVRVAPIEDPASVKPNTTRHPGGRPNLAAMIEAAIRGMWEPIQRSLERTGRVVPVWSELARAVEKHLKNAAAKNNRPIPHVETIRTRLPKIYARVLAEQKCSIAVPLN